MQRYHGAGLTFLPVQPAGSLIRAGYEADAYGLSGNDGRVSSKSFRRKKQTGRDANTALALSKKITIAAPGKGGTIRIEVSFDIFVSS